MESILEDFVLPVIAILAIFGSMFGVTAIFLISRNRERIKLIESGRDPGVYEKLKRDPMMTWALLAAGIGVGLLFGYALEQVTDIPGEIAYTSLVLLCSGAGLYVNHMIQKGAASTSSPNNEL